MAAAVEFVVRPELLVGLGSLVPMTKSTISPLSDRPLDPSEIATLKEKGVLDAHGQPLPHIMNTLEGLAASQAYFQVRLHSGALFLEYVFHRASDGRQIVLATTRDELCVTDPAPTEDILTGICQFLGGSILRTLEFQAELGWQEALVLCALLDRHRQAVLRSVTDDLPVDSQGFTISSVEQATRAREDTVQWLASLIRLIAPADIVVDVPAALAGLTRQGHCAGEGGRYRLIGPAALLGSRFLLVEQVLLWGAGRVSPQGQGVQVNQLCLQAGVHDILTLEASESGVSFSGASPAAVAEAMRLFLGNPDALPLPKPAAAQCPSCGLAFGPGQRFCSQCGARLSQ